MFHTYCSRSQIVLLRAVIAFEKLLFFLIFPGFNLILISQKWTKTPSGRIHWACGLVTAQRCHAVLPRDIQMHIMDMDISRTVLMYHRLVHAHN